MARDITVHKGTMEIGDREVPIAWLETSLRLEPEVHDLTDALGSKFIRNNIQDDDHAPDMRPEGLPDGLTQREILSIYREEYKYWGSANLGTWKDAFGSRHQEHIEKWLAELVVSAFPELKEYTR